MVSGYEFDDYDELKMMTKTLFQIFGLWIRAMIYTYPFNVIQVKSIHNNVTSVIILKKILLTLKII